MRFFDGPLYVVILTASFDVIDSLNRHSVSRPQCDDEFGGSPKNPPQVPDLVESGDPGLQSPFFTPGSLLRHHNFRSIFQAEPTKSALAQKARVFKTHYSALSQPGHNMLYIPDVRYAHLSPDMKR